MNVELNPWITPNFVTAKMPAMPRQEGFQYGPKWALKDLDAQTLSDQCDKFRAEIFKKAGKPDPSNARLTDAGPDATKLT
jgi:hypothetical protein